MHGSRSAPKIFKMPLKRHCTKDECGRKLTSDYIAWGYGRNS